jgi:hypothetical protein
MNIYNNEESLNRKQEEINHLLDLIDPYRCNKITLSDIILLFSKSNINMLDSQIFKSSTKK